MNKQVNPIYKLFQTSNNDFYMFDTYVHMAHPNGRVCGAKRPKCEAERSHHL